MAGTCRLTQYKVMYLHVLWKIHTWVLFFYKYFLIEQDLIRKVCKRVFSD